MGANDNTSLHSYTWDADPITNATVFLTQTSATSITNSSRFGPSPWPFLATVTCLYVNYGDGVSGPIHTVSESDLFAHLTVLSYLLLGPPACTAHNFVS